MRRRSTNGTTNRSPATGCHMVLLVLVLAVASCQQTRPDFAERSRQDCARGDGDACRMLEAMIPPRVGNPLPARPSRVEADVEAILQGMEQARMALSAGEQENAPSQAEPSQDGPPRERPAIRPPLPQQPGVP